MAHDHTPVPYYAETTPFDRLMRGDLSEDDVDANGRIIQERAAQIVSKRGADGSLLLQQKYLRAIVSIEQHEDDEHFPIEMPACCNRLFDKVEVLEARIAVVERELHLMRRACTEAGLHVSRDPYS